MDGQELIGDPILEGEVVAFASSLSHRKSQQDSFTRAEVPTGKTCPRENLEVYQAR